MALYDDGSSITINSKCMIIGPIVTGNNSSHMAENVDPWKLVRVFPWGCKVEGLYPRNKISVITDISVLGFYGYIENIGKYRWIF